MAAIQEPIYEAWRALCGRPESFSEAGRLVCTHEDGDGHVSVVRLGDRELVLAPPQLSETLSNAGAVDLGDPERFGALCGDPGEVIGPAALAFDGEAVSHERPTGVVVLTFGAGEPEYDKFRAEVSEDDVRESAADDLLMPLSAAYDGDHLVAVAGWEPWPPAVAHIGVLTHPDWRRRGFGRAAAVHAVQRARKAGLTPQWRAREDLAASRAMAKSLGLVEGGRQVMYLPPL